jgi:hypothetical protein
MQDDTTSRRIDALPLTSDLPPSTATASDLMTLLLYLEKLDARLSILEEREREERERNRDDYDEA